jgi:hypothetical protein
MSSGTSRAETMTRVAPIQALGRTALLSGVFSLLPVFAAVTYLAHDSTALPVIVACEILLALAFLTVYIRFRRVYTAVTRTHFVKRRMLLPSVSVNRARIHRLLVHRVYRSNSTESLTMLIGVDPLGRRVLGMNSLFWTDDDIQLVIDALGVQTSVDPTAIPRGDYFRELPAARAWYFSRPVIVGATVCVAILLVLVVLTLERVVGTA